MKKIITLLLLACICTTTVCTHTHTVACGEDGVNCTHVHSEDLGIREGKPNLPPEK